MDSRIRYEPRWDSYSAVIGGKPRFTNPSLSAVEHWLTEYDREQEYDQLADRYCNRNREEI